MYLIVDLAQRSATLGVTAILIARFAITLLTRDACLRMLSRRSKAEKSCEFIFQSPPFVGCIRCPTATNPRPDAISASRFSVP